MNERRAAVTEKVATKIDRFLNKNFSSTKNSFFFSFCTKANKAAEEENTRAIVTLKKFCKPMWS